jgi:hypothetical protein
MAMSRVRGSEPRDPHRTAPYCAIPQRKLLSPVLSLSCASSPPPPFPFSPTVPLRSSNLTSLRRHSVVVIASHRRITVRHHNPMSSPFCSQSLPHDRFNSTSSPLSSAMAPPVAPRPSRNLGWPSARAGLPTPPFQRCRRALPTGDPEEAGAAEAGESAGDGGPPPRL